MAIDATPKRSRRFRRRPIIIGSLVLFLVLLCGGGGYLAVNAASTASQAAATGQWKTAKAEIGTIDAKVSATGNVVPHAQANLNFAVSGIVTKVMVNPGDVVKAGQPLAQIDPTDLQLSLDKAQADLKSAQASYQKLIDGATPEEIAAAKAQLAQAQGSYQQTVGSVTQSDIDAGRAKLEAARANLASLQAGHTSMSDAQMSLDKTKTDLAAKRDSLSAAKTNAQLGLQTATNSLTQAQSTYATAKGNWDYVNGTGKDASNPTLGIDPKTGKKIPNKVSNTQRQQYYDTFVQAEASLHNAEAAVAKAQVDYDNARQAEVTGVQSAEQDVTTAQASLDKLRSGGNTNELASARAQVESAQAALDQLVGANRRGALVASKAAIDNAQAGLDKLTSDPRASDLASADASVAIAEVAVKQAQRQLDLATLKAPFDATVAKVDLRVGEAPGANTTTTDTSSTSTSSTNGQIIIADTSNFEVKVPVDELDIAQLRKGQQVEMSLDALPDANISGEVTNIEPLATKSSQGTTTYQVTVRLNKTNEAVLPGMTVSANVVTRKKDNAILVPRRAVQTENGQNFVYVPTTGQPDKQTGRPASTRQAVSLGLSNDQSIEITSGLKAGDTVLIQDVVSTLNPVGRGQD